MASSLEPRNAWKSTFRTEAVAVDDRILIVGATMPVCWRSRWRRKPARRPGRREREIRVDIRNASGTGLWSRSRRNDQRVAGGGRALFACRTNHRRGPQDRQQEMRASSRRRPGRRGPGAGRDRERDRNGGGPECVIGVDLGTQQRGGHGPSPSSRWPAADLKLRATETGWATRGCSNSWGAGRPWPGGGGPRRALLVPARRRRPPGDRALRPRGRGGGHAPGLGDDAGP